MLESSFVTLCMQSLYSSKSSAVAEMGDCLVSSNYFLMVQCFWLNCRFKSRFNWYL